MYKFKPSQMIIYSLLALLLVVYPLLSSSLRPTYLYFIFNILIIALGAESGLLSSLLSNPNPNNNTDDKIKPQNIVISQPRNLTNNNGGHGIGFKDHINDAAGGKKMGKKPVVEKCKSEKIARSDEGGLTVSKVKKCRSTPSIFYIEGSCDTQLPEETGVEDEVMEDDGISEQELFTQAETFIGNFYKQLKMQREESWNKIHGLYQKAL